MQYSEKELTNISTQIRRDIIRMVNGANSGHPGGSLGCADLLTVLFFHTMQFKTKPFNASGMGEDVFYLSNGHISPLFYAVLARAGFFDIKELADFRKINTRLQGHPTNHDNLPGIRVSSGSLGQGMSVACGTALAKKSLQDDKYVFVLTGDGELQEGQIWESAMFAVHHKLDNLITIVDNNHQQIDGPVEEVLSLGNVAQKFVAFGWEVLKMNGHNINEIITTIDKAKKVGKSKKLPVLILMESIMGKGVDFMENSHKWHGVAPNEEQTKEALSQLTLAENILNDY